MKQKIILTSLVALPLLSAQAAITYVDAVEGSSGNTFETGSTLGDTAWLDPNGSFSANETQWGERDDGGNGFGNGGSIYQVFHEVINSDDMPELTTQITGLADNTYDVWVFFWDPDNAEFTIDAGLTSGSLDVYSFDGPGDINAGPGDTTSPVDAGTLTFSNSPTPLTDEGNRTLYGVNLGQATVSGGSAIDVFIDNTTGGLAENRTWYDGVGYEVVPEPAAAAGLAGIAVLGLALLRRRR